MDLPAQVSQVIAYNEWANGRVFDAAANLSPEALEDGVGLGIMGVLRHTVLVQLEWVAALHGQAELGEVPLETMADINRAFTSSHQGLRALAGSVDGEGWDGPVGGMSVTLGTVLIQLLVHGVQHRAEAGLMLDVAGLSPGDLDYLYFKSEHLEL